MNLEIERKYLVVGEEWRGSVVDSRRMVQGYVCVTERGSVRIRVAGERAYLTVKSRRVGDQRDEYEYEIDPLDAERMLKTVCEPGIVEKTRHRVPLGSLTAEIDEFVGANAGLVIVEIELMAHQTLPPSLPSWIGVDVTEEDRYYSSTLSKRPFTTWASP